MTRKGRGGGRIPTSLVILLGSELKVWLPLEERGLDAAMTLAENRRGARSTRLRCGWGQGIRAVEAGQATPGHHGNKVERASSNAAARGNRLPSKPPAWPCRGFIHLALEQAFQKRTKRSHILPHRQGDGGLGLGRTNMDTGSLSRFVGLGEMLPALSNRLLLHHIRGHRRYCILFRKNKAESCKVPT